MDEAAFAEQLVERIKNGEKDAERDLVERYQRGLFFVLRRKCSQDAVLAQDLMQDTWQIVIEKIRADKIREPQKLAAFIVQTGKNAVIAHFRKIENKGSSAVDSHSLDTNLAQLVDQRDNPEQKLLNYNLGLMVKKVILEMEQTRDKDILFSLFLNQQDKKTICQNLGLDSEHFDRVLYRAKLRFRKIWEQHHNTS